MKLNKRIYSLSEKFADFLVERATPLGFPARGSKFPPVLMIALPKSGSIYLQRALGRTLQVQVHHFSAAGISGSSFALRDLTRFAAGNVISREHLQPREVSLKVLGNYGINRAVLHVRDPRGAMISWTKHMDRALAARGLRYVELSCEMLVPDSYEKWDFNDRLKWQVENKMPDFVRWIEGWLTLTEKDWGVEFLITDYGDLQKDGRALVTRILDFYRIPYQPDWISMPTTEYGKNNIYSNLKDEAADALPSWAKQMPADLLATANAMLPATLRDRFGWPKID